MHRTTHYKLSETQEQIQRWGLRLDTRIMEDRRAECTWQRQNPPYWPQDLGYQLGMAMVQTLLSMVERTPLKIQGTEYTLRKSHPLIPFIRLTILLKREEQIARHPVSCLKKMCQNLHSSAIR